MSYTAAEVYESDLLGEADKNDIAVLAPEGGYVVRGSLFVAKLFRFVGMVFGVLFVGMLIVWVMALVTGHTSSMGVIAAVGLAALFLNRMMIFIFTQTSMRVTYRFGVLAPRLRERGLILDEVPADEDDPETDGVSSSGAMTIAARLEKVRQKA